MSRNLCWNYYCSVCNSRSSRVGGGGVGGASEAKCCKFVRLCLYQWEHHGNYVVDTCFSKWQESTLIFVVEMAAISEKGINVSFNPYSRGQMFTSPFYNLQNVNYFTKIRGIIQNACYCLLSTRENNSWIYKNDPVQKFTSPWFLILCSYLNDPQRGCCCFFGDSCLWIPCLPWTVKLPKFFGFPAFLHT